MNLRVGPGTFRNPHLVGEAILGHALECMGVLFVAAWADAAQQSIEAMR